METHPAFICILHGKGAEMSEEEDNEYSSLPTFMILVFSICNLKLIILHMNVFV
jgi:hypothetical protein